MKGIKQKQSGFTIVELLVAIVVIAILAAITVVAYNGIQDRARTSLVRNSLTQKAKQLELDKVDRGEYAPTLADITIAQSDDGPVNFQYTREGSGADSAFCLTGVLQNITLHIRNGNTAAEEGGCDGHSDPNVPPPEVVYQAFQKFNIPGGTTPVEDSHTINFNLQPSDLVFVVYDMDFYSHIHSVTAGSTTFDRVYRKTMGAAGYQQIVAYKATGLSGNPTLITRSCWGGNNESACYEGSSSKGEYLVYVIRGKDNPTVVYSDTSFGAQTRGATIAPASIAISPNDLALFAYVYYGSYLPTIQDVSSPAVSWTVDASKTAASAQVGGANNALSVFRGAPSADGTVAPSLLMPSSGTVYAGATLFVVK